MADPYVGEIRLFAGSYAPVGWQLCDGSLLQITSYEVLYAVLGSIYGGNGTTTFAVPDLRSKVPISQGTGLGLTPRTVAEVGGAETVTLATANLPLHAHAAEASTTNATTTTAGPGVVLATVQDTTAGQTDARYLPSGKVTSSTETLSTNQVALAGSTMSHTNIMPSIALTYIIALQGIYPSTS
jgi:microcystin-dependent protein